MADYCTYAEIKAVMPDSPLVQMGATEHENAFDALITRASRLIDKEVGRWPNYFYPTTDAQTRYFDGSGEKEQWIDECLTLTTLAVAESWLKLLPPDIPHGRKISIIWCGRITIPTCTAGYLSGCGLKQRQRQVPKV